MIQEIVQGDCLELLKQLKDNCIDAVVCDPSYGMSKEPDIAEVMRHWLAGDRYEHGGSGFMGKNWDSFVPGPEYWRECFRVLKPGGHLLAFSSTRTDDLLSIAIRFAGFERRDEIRCEGIGSLAWLYGSGFPKSLNVSKAIDDAAGEAEQWEGWGTAMKPAWEPVLVFRKPLAGTVAANVLEYGTGALNIDACRIRSFVGASEETFNTPTSGRWPANVVLCHLDDCECVGEREVKANGAIGAHTAAAAAAAARVERVAMRGDDRPRGEWQPYGNGDGTETVEKWECAPGCPVAALDMQSGFQKDGVAVQRNGGGQKIGGVVAYGGSNGLTREDAGYGGGGASRFFYVAKTSRSEREAGLAHLPAKTGAQAVEREEGSAGTKSPRAGAGRTAREVRNVHPTVKPIALMRWLVRLVTPPNGICLDPFAGSGTTGCACALERFNFIGFEQDAEYVKIAAARIQYWKEVVSDVDANERQ